MQNSEPKNMQKHICCRCGKLLPQSSYFKSASMLYAAIGHLPICKECLVREYKKYKIQYQNASDAMKSICMHFDIYYNDSLFNECKNDDDKIVGAYIRRMNLGQYKTCTFDTSIAEGFFFTGEKESVVSPPSDDKEEKPVDPRLVEKWGEGLTHLDYSTLEDHYKYLKSANPNCDSNQEIFIIDLCYTKMQQMRAVRESRVDDFSKLTDSYRKTFAQAGLKTVQDTSINSDDCWGVWQERISQYTPEEYYKNKKLYKDFDGLGDYMQRFVLRPLRNLMHGTHDRDPEYCVKDASDEQDVEFPESE